MQQITIIGDIHGNHKTFLALLEKIPKEDTIVVAGDLVDRGPDSKGIVQYVIDNNILCVLGNHEKMMSDDILKNKTPYEGEWLAHQAGKTLDSYRKPDYTVDWELMKVHSEWMSKLPLYLEFPDTFKIGYDTDHGRKRHLVVSHASIGSTWKFRDPSHPKHHFFKDNAIWNRDRPDDVLDIYSVFGHTPVNIPRITNFYANIDTGCVFKRDWSEQYGYLTALRFPAMEVISQKNIDVLTIEEKNDRINKEGK